MRRVSRPPRPLLAERGPAEVIRQRRRQQERRRRRPSSAAALRPGPGHGLPLLRVPRRDGRLPRHHPALARGQGRRRGAAEARGRGPRRGAAPDLPRHRVRLPRPRALPGRERLRPFQRPHARRRLPVDKLPARFNSSSKPGGGTRPGRRRGCHGLLWFPDQRQAGALGPAARGGAAPSPYFNSLNAGAPCPACPQTVSVEDGVEYVVGRSSASARLPAIAAHAAPV